MELIRRESMTTLRNSGVESQQLHFPENSASQPLTITRVTMKPGVSIHAIYTRLESQCG